MPSNPKTSDTSSIINELLKRNIEFILIGGQAAVVQGAIFTTFDIDILQESSEENIARLVNFLDAHSAKYRRPDDIIRKPRQEDFTGKGYFLFSTSLGPLDVLFSIEENLTYNDLIEDSVDIVFNNRTLKVLSLKKMIELKRSSGDAKSKQQLPFLEEALNLSKESE